MSTHGTIRDEVQRAPAIAGDVLLYQAARIRGASSLDEVKSRIAAELDQGRALYVERTGDAGTRVDAALAALLPGDAAQSELLHQSVLQRQVGAFHAALGGGRVRADDVDVEIAQCASELRDAIAALRILRVDAKHRELVAIERNGLAVSLQVTTGRLEVVERGLGREAQTHRRPSGASVTR
jgi:hypothetical protein